METSAEDFLAYPEWQQGVRRPLSETAFTILAVNLAWLAHPGVGSRTLPNAPFKAKRGITLAEHQRILAAERIRNANLFYQLLWEIGSSQSDAANLSAENIDWADPQSHLISDEDRRAGATGHHQNTAKLLEQLPTTGSLFPKISASADSPF